MSDQKINQLGIPLIEGPKEGELIAEYGSTGNVSFASATMYDAEGKEVLCKCGKPSSCAIIGKSSQLVFCTDCSPLERREAKFIYRKPDQCKAG